jgi:hypothetical protein
MTFGRCGPASRSNEFDGSRDTCATMVSMTPKSLCAFFFALSLAANVLTVQAQENAVLPYSLVSKYLELFQSLGHLDRIVPGLLVASTDPGVKPQDIRFRVLTKSGWQNFSPDDNGNIRFPYQPDWADLVLFSNQPKGSLQLGVGFSAKLPDTTRTTYQELMKLVPQFEEALTALAKLQGQPAPKVKGLSIQMPEGPDASIRVLSRKDQQVLSSYVTGIIVIRYDEALWVENPPVEFDELPIGIVPLK